MAGAHKILQRGIFTQNFAKRDIKRRQNYSSLFMLFGKEIWKNGIFESKTKRRILEGMLTSCPGLEQLNFWHNCCRASECSSSLIGAVGSQKVNF